MAISAGAYILAQETSGILGAMEKAIKQDSERHKEVYAKVKKKLIEESGLEQAIYHLYVLMPSTSQRKRTAYLCEVVTQLGISDDEDITNLIERDHDAEKYPYMSQRKYEARWNTCINQIRNAVKIYNQKIENANQVIKEDYRKHIELVSKCNAQYSKIRSSFRRLTLDPITLSPNQVIQVEWDIAHNFTPTKYHRVDPITIREEDSLETIREYFALYSQNASHKYGLWDRIQGFFEYT